MQTILNKALQFLARREYSEQELLQKLSLKFPEQHEEIIAALTQLKAMKYLDNTRFIESRIRHRSAQGYGPNRIMAELTQVHGLTTEEIRPYLTFNKEDEVVQIKTLIQKKFKSLDLQDWQVRNRVIAHCLRRGFPLQVIQHALDAIDR